MIPPVSTATSVAKIAVKINRHLVKWLFLASLGFYLLISQGFVSPQGYDAESFFTAEQIVETGKLYVYGIEPLTYPRNGIVQPVIMIPWYLVCKFLAPLVPKAFGSEWLAAWFNPILVSLTVVYIYLFCYKLGRSQPAALLAALLAAFTSMLVPYSQIGMETLQCLSTIATIYYLYSYKKEGRLLDLLWAGLIAGILINSKRLSIPLIAPIGLYCLYCLCVRNDWRSRRFWLSGLLWIGPILAGFGIIYWYESFRDSQIASPNAIAFFDVMSDFRLLGFYSYLFSLNKSLFVYSPTLVLALIGWSRFWRAYQAEALLFAGLIFITLSTVGITVSYGDEVWGPRYALVIVPLGYVIAAGVLESRSSWTAWKRGGLIGLGLVGGFVQFLGSIFYYGRYVFFLADAGLSSLQSYGETFQTSAVYIHFLMLVSSICHRLFNFSLYLDYRVYYWPKLPDPRPKVVYNGVFWKLDLPKPNLAEPATIEQWNWKVLSSSNSSNFDKIAAVIVTLFLIYLVSSSLWKLRKYWSYKSETEKSSAS
jgi:hypothetical protein